MNKIATTAEALPRTNPFSSNAVRPGAIPYLFTGAQPGEDNLAGLVARFEAAHLRGQIVGPHGNGKSTLLAALLPCLTDLGYPVHAIALHDGQRQLPADFLQEAFLQATSLQASFLRAEGEQRTIIVIDGYEQLSWLQRWRLKRLCNRNDSGLLVVTHNDVGLPTLCTPKVTPTLTKRIIDGILTDREYSVDEQEVADLLAQHGGNLRDVLFDLYDRYEQVR